MEEQERLTKGIWIPIEIWKDKKLTWNEKILFLEIDSYTSKDKDCYFSNEYISELLGISITNASKTISSLIEKGYIVKTKFDGRKRYVKTALSYSTSQTCQERQPSHACAISDIKNNTSNDIINKDNKEEGITIPPKKNDYQAIFDCWNKYNGKKISKVTQFTDARKKAIKKMLDIHNISQDVLMRFFASLPFADQWLFHPTGTHKLWKPTFDWWMSNTNGWLTKGLEGGVHLENPQAFERIMNGETFSSPSVMYLPQGRNVWFNDETKSYWSMDNFYDGKIYDGYSDDDRPDGAEITLNNARGTIVWNKQKRQWIKQQ